MNVTTKVSNAAMRANKEVRPCLKQLLFSEREKKRARESQRMSRNSRSVFTRTLVFLGRRATILDRKKLLRVSFGNGYAASTVEKRAPSAYVISVRGFFFTSHHQLQQQLNKLYVPQILQRCICNVTHK